MRSEPAPNAQPPSIMVDDILYYSTGTPTYVDFNEDEYLGKITSVVNISQKPTENGQANIPFEGAPYVEYKDGLALLEGDELIYFETREND